MQKKLLFNIILLLGVNLLIKPFWILGIDRSFQNLVGNETYGIYANLFSISMILTMLLDFGINNFNSSTIATDPSKLSSQFSSLISLKFLLSGLYLLLTFIWAYLYGAREEMLGFILLLSLNQVIAHFSTFIRSCITGIQLFKTDALLSAVDRFVMILLGLLMVRGIFFEVNLYYFIVIQTMGYVAVMILGLVILFPHLTFFKFSFKWDLLRELFHKTLPYALLSFVMLLYSRSDMLLMKKMLVNGDLENGIFASGGRLLEAANMMIGATAVIMVPFFARMISSRENLSGLSRILSTIVLLPVILFAVLCSTYNHEIMKLLSPQSSAYTAEVFGLLILCFIPYSFMYIYGSMLTAGAQLRILNTICIIALIVNIISNLLLIPLLGAKGAAITALITHSIVGFGKFGFAVVRLELKHPAGYYLKFIGYLVSATGLVLVLHRLEVALEITLASGVLFTLCWILVFKMIGIRNEMTLLWQNIKSIKK